MKQKKEIKECGVGRRVRLRLLGLLAVGLAVGLHACIGNWSGTSQEATLIIGNPVVSGGKGQVFLSVANMPKQGLASLAVDVGGMTYTDTKVTNVTLVGLNGFTVLASEFTGGNGRFVIANPTSGSVGGTVAKLTFDATGTVTKADFTFVKAKITLGSALNTLITTWTLGTEKAYYAK